MKLSIVMPAYNEMASIRQVIPVVWNAPGEKELIIVDDCSTDGTREYLQQLAKERPELTILFQARNQGKGAALRRGFEVVTGDIVIVQDADLEYSPSEYAALIQPIVDGKADVVYGSRFMTGPRRVLFFWHSVGNQLLTSFSNMCTDLNLTDMETCYKAFRVDVIRRIELKSNRFGCEPEITAKVARLGYRIYEVPVSYNGREYWEGKKIGWRDGLAAFFQIIKYAFLEPAEKPDPRRRSLEALARSTRHNAWIMQMIRPQLGPRVLELEGGLGGFTRFLIDRDLVVTTDRHASYRAILKEMFAKYPHVKVEDFDIERDGLVLPSSYQFSGILCGELLAYLEDDSAALRRLSSLTEPGGSVALVLPATPWIYGARDKQLGRKRRYSRKDITTKLTGAGFKVERVRHFNLPGIFGWWLNSCVLRRRFVQASRLRLYDALVPWLRCEQWFGLPFGMSILVIARKPADAKGAAS